MLKKKLGRWIPLLSVLALVVASALRAGGQLGNAEGLETITQLLGLVVTDPETLAMVGAATGLARKVYKMFRAATSVDPK